MKDRLRKFRQKHNISQEVLAVLLGVSRRTIIDWESGKRGPHKYLEYAMNYLDRCAGELNGLKWASGNPATKKS